MYGNYDDGDDDDYDDENEYEYEYENENEYDDDKSSVPIGGEQHAPLCITGKTLKDVVVCGCVKLYQVGEAAFGCGVLGF